MDARELAHHAAQLPGFGWIRGMHTIALDDVLPDLSEPGTQGCFLELIARINIRRSKVDAIRSVAAAMGRGLSIEEALVYELEQHGHRVGSTRHRAG